MIAKFMLLAALLAIPASASAAPVGFFNVEKAISASSDARKAVEEGRADAKAKQADVDKADAEAKAAEAACEKAPKACADARQKRAHVDELGRRYLQEIQQAEQNLSRGMSARLDRIVPAVRKAKHLDALIGFTGASDVAPGLDFTAEITRRFDLGEGKGEAELAAENAKLKARNAELEAKEKAPAAPPEKSVKTSR